MGRLWCGLGFRRRFESLQFQLPVFQGMNQPFNDGNAFGCFTFVPCANLEISMCMEFLGPFAERLAQTLTKLELSFALCRIAVGEPVLAEVIDRRQDFLKPVDAARELFKKGGFRSRSLLFPCACSGHGCRKSLTEG